MESIGWELLRAIGQFFLQPQFYFVLLFAVLLGYVRVKRERRSFRTRILGGWTELKDALIGGLLWSLILSVIVLAIGLIIPTEWLFLYGFTAVLFMLIWVYSIGSPVIVGAVAALIWYIDTTYDFGLVTSTFHSDSLVPVALLLGLAVIVEGLLIRKKSAAMTSPFLVTTSRGLKAALYRSKHLWLLPLVVFIPGDVIPNYLPYWPVFNWGNETYGLFILPVVIGFSHTARHFYPADVMSRISKAVIGVGIITVIAAACGYQFEWMGMAAIAVGSVLRIIVAIYFAIKERVGAHAVTPQNEGVVIAAVLPGSPADKMGLKLGECIRRVNGQRISDEKELYEAIQINAAHCRLEVLDTNGEVRLRQHVIYRHDHHRLGILVVR